LTQDQLARTILPLGEMRKPAVRQSARDHGLSVLADKPDSQEICFVPGGDYKVFLDAYLAEQGRALPDTAGDIVTRSGEVVGHHAGIHGFTVGQRKGLSVPNSPGAGKHDPLYVLEISGERKQVVVGGAHELLSKHARVRN